MVAAHLHGLAVTITIAFSQNYSVERDVRDAGGRQRDRTTTASFRGAGIPRAQRYRGGVASSGVTRHTRQAGTVLHAEKRL